MRSRNCCRAPMRGRCWTILTSRSGWRAGKGRKSKASNRLKITVLAPMPSASSPAIASVEPGVLRSMRRPMRRSCMTAHSNGGSGRALLQKTTSGRPRHHVIIGWESPNIIRSLSCERKLRLWAPAMSARIARCALPIRNSPMSSWWTWWRVFRRARGSTCSNPARSRATTSTSRAPTITSPRRIPISPSSPPGSRASRA